MTVTRNGAELSPPELYSVLRLRFDTFVLEQRSFYPELDGRDLLPTTRHFWVADDAEVVSYLRVLPVGDGFRVGRVCTRPDRRRQGLCNHLLEAAVAARSGHVLTLNAQSYAVDLYRRFGFRASGPDFLEDGIPHTPMRRDPDC